ncbi:MAG: 5-methyltetrahydropteroyltriglutamate--homocysteine S-methyltransferase [Actinobacteria bacterium]|nr:5-methyltetrahydropteroyltriglutamate--homocysteine S-methyltransferase [Actinomycetota bacterium]
MTTFPAATILGYPRIGRDREFKKAVEAFWAGRASLEDTQAALAAVRAQTRERLAGLGLTEPYSVPADATGYDQVWDIASSLGIVPARFDDLRAEDGSLDLAAYWTVARGVGDRPPLEMTKWFDSNYHYLVPEIGPDTDIRLVDDRVVRLATEAPGLRPVVVGPVTLALLSKAADGAPEDFTPLDRLDDVVAAYADLLRALAAAGVEWVQLDEPALVADTWPREDIVAATSSAYAVLGGLAERPAILVVGSYGPLGDALPALAASRVEAIGLDLVRGDIPDDVDILTGKTVVAGVIDGRNIWRADLQEAFGVLGALGARLGDDSPVSVATSTSLMHVPHDVEREGGMYPELRTWLAFADQKVGEVLTLARGLAEGRDAIAPEIAESVAVRARRAAHPGVRAGEVPVVPDAFRSREAYADRVAAQEDLGLGALPTTTIGSFPQTGEIRRARAAHRAGTMSDADYDAAMRAEIARVVELQERLGLDVLVHGEAERNDMVQYFAENLEGFATTEHGWVQSYGSRCTRPSILWGAVRRRGPITVEWSRYAQSLTGKPMKGMLTGPVTILAWSFVRDDQPLAVSADQVALALREEVADLERAGIRVVQVDEPALRELLPLRSEDQPAYISWSVRAFRLATSGVRPSTQIHTHLCYSEFNEIIDAIDGLDADVTSIEAARSRMEVLEPVEDHGFARGIGPGVYDIHSPRVPSVEEMEAQLRLAVGVIADRRLWVNPDCGLKTRGYAEVEPALANMVEAARRVRQNP